MALVIVVQGVDGSVMRGCGDGSVMRGCGDGSVMRGCGDGSGMWGWECDEGSYNLLIT